ncbi:MAG: group II intron reverse transcriptase/maturase [Acidimicrobiales bacterium]|jgi:RNA-directed DNA polymerase
MGPEPRGRADQGTPEANPAGEEPTERPKAKVKSFEIDKRLVYEAWEKVRANKGAPGVDAISVELFESQLKDNLYKLWNRLSSGSYFPGPVRGVEIPKDHGAGVRLLGVPNTVDRVAQTAAAMLLEAKLEPIFHPDSYGYRPGRSALDALAVARKRCWEKDWVVDFDIRAFFDSVPHDLLLKAVAHHTDERWVLLYISRWLVAPVQMPDGTIVAREKGTPQGSPISPVLANLFMHYAFDRWMDREFPGSPFERYADDVLAHCGSEGQARELRAAVAERLGALGLELHPDKTKIVYCKDANRRGNFEHTSFDYLGYTFRERLAIGPRGYFSGFSPAMSNGARKAVGQKVRAWHLNRRSDMDLSDLAEAINPQVRGWVNYYGAFYRSELRFLAWRINEHLARWAMQKFKRFRGRYLRAMEWLQRVFRHQPALFVHWKLVAFTARRTVGAG